MSRRRSRRPISALLVAAAVTALVACSDAVDPSLLSDAELSEDLAWSSGEAIATDIVEMVANEVFGGIAPVEGLAAAASAPEDLTITRTRTCYDANDAVQDACDPATTASMRIQMTLDGSRERENFSMIVHRSRDLVISGLLGQETSRTHNGVGTSADTTEMTRDARSRKVEEASSDSVRNVVFNLPHATNPWPVSGEIVRHVDATITVTDGDRTETRSINRRIVVTFPPDGQGNVSIQVNDVTCTLNLVTRRVVNCQQ